MVKQLKWNLAVSTTYLIPPAYWNTNKLTEVNICKVLNEVNIYAINHYLLWWLRCGVNVIKIGQKLLKLLSKNLKCWQKDEITEFRTCWKQYTPLKLRFVGGITIIVDKWKEKQTKILLLSPNHEYNICLYTQKHWKKKKNYFHARLNIEREREKERKRERESCWTELRFNHWILTC